MSLQAYQSTQKTIENPRDTEYRVFGQVTHRLVEINQKQSDHKARIEAIGNNRKLWSALAVDCADSGNQLSERLRAQIISLSIWVSKYSSDVMQKNAPIEPLIDVNRAIMEGLKQRPA